MCGPDLAQLQRCLQLGRLGDIPSRHILRDDSTIAPREISSAAVAVAADASISAAEESIVMVWPIDWVAKLTKCYAEGMSQTKIANAFGKGVTRNAIAGKIYRLGLHREETEKRGRPAKLPPLFTPPPDPLIPPIMPPDTVHVPKHPVTIYDLNHHHCRWPIGEAPKIKYCGDPRIAGSSYCDYHHAKANVKTASRLRP